MLLLHEIKDLIAGSLRLVFIGLSTMQEKPEFQRLQMAYRSAWREFVIAIERWQSHTSDSLAAQQSALLLEQAESVYRKSRNELANYMLSGTSKSLSNVERLRPRAETFRVAGASVTN